MATRFPPEWLDALRARADIVSIVSEYVPLKLNGRRYWGLCPFHGEKTASFSVDPDKQLFYCFGCKAGGSVIQFIMDAERMEFSEAVAHLADKVRLPLPTATTNPAEDARRRSLRERILEINRLAAQFFHRTLYAPEGARILDYLHGRGLDDAAIRLFGLGAAPGGWDTLTTALMDEGCTEQELTAAGLTVIKGEKRFDMFRARAIFPIISAHGAVLGFGGRAMGDAQPKYLNSPDTPAFNKRQNAYAVNLLRKEKGLTRVLLVEGYMDVVALVTSGVPGVVATLGTALTPEQARLMKRYAPEIWVAYDGDDAGQNATLRALDVFAAQDIPARVLVIPGGQDPDDFIRAQGRVAFDALTPLSAPVYRMQRAAEGLDLSTEEGRTQYAVACASILKAVKQPVELENLLQRLMIETGYAREVLLRQIGIAEVARPRYAEPRTSVRDTPTLQKRGERFHAERTLLALLGEGLVPPGMLNASRFSDAAHRALAERLIEGASAAALLEEAEGEEERTLLLEVLGQETPLGGEPVRIVTDCLETMRRAELDERIAELSETLNTVTDRGAIIAEIASLMKEKTRLAPGRKE